MKEIITLDEVKTGWGAITWGKNFIAKAISEFEEGWRNTNPPSHALIFVNHASCLSIIEADGTKVWGKPGVSEVSFTKWWTGKPDSTMMLLVPIEDTPKITESLMLKYLNKQIGKKYDYRGVTWEAKRYIIKFLTFGAIDIAKRTVPPDDPDKAWWCSELFGWQQNTYYWLFDNWRTLSPKDIYDVAKSYYYCYLYDKENNYFKRDRQWIQV